MILLSRVVEEDNEMNELSDGEPDWTPSGNQVSLKRPWSDPEISGAEGARTALESQT